MSAADAQMAQALGLDVVYRITGDQIISSNASRVEGNTAIWDFPTQIEVTLVPAAQFSPDMVSLAEFAEGEKNAISHRARALRALAEKLRGMHYPSKP